MAVDNATNVRQTNAGTLEIGGAMQSLENAEQFVGVAHVESHSIIANENDVLTLIIGTPDLNPRLFAWSRILKRIGEQVE